MLLCKTALGRLLSRLLGAATRLTRCRGYLCCGLALNWAGLAVLGSLTYGTGYTGAHSGAVLQWEWQHWCCVVMPALGHTRVTGLQPFTLVSAHSRHARHWSHHRISGVDCIAPHDPTNRPYGLVRLRGVGALPPHSASSLELSARATFLYPATRPKSSFVHW